MTNGISVVQEGVSVDSAQDSQISLDSRWLYMEMSHEEIISLPTITSGKTTPLFTHGLGFLPAFTLYDIDTDSYISGDSTGGLRASESQIYFGGSFLGSYSNHRALLRIYDVAITEEYIAPITSTLPVKDSQPSGVGIRITDGDFRNPELSAFTLNTSGKTPSIQRTGLTTASAGSNNEAVITHNLGYPPTYLTAFADIAGNWVGSINPSFVPVISRANGVTLTFSGAQGALNDTFAYIIFKELGDYIL